MFRGSQAEVTPEYDGCVLFFFFVGLPHRDVFILHDEYMYDGMRGGRGRMSQIESSRARTTHPMRERLTWPITKLLVFFK